jgi:ABC-type lipoprotein release transport system permease subunit
MTTAVVGIGGTILGVVLGSLLNFLLQKRQEERRWKREAQSKYALERLALYRDFLNEMEHVRLGGKGSSVGCWSGRRL